MVDLSTTAIGPDVIRLFIPHRRPFLMVDRLTGLSLGERPSLRACRFISANDPVFDGHFPTLALLPGAMVLEGLGQSCALLSALTAQGMDEATLVAELINLELGASLREGHDPARAAALVANLRPQQAIGVLGATSLKFVRPVFAGCRLDYTVTRAALLGDAWHFRVEAAVDGEEVVRGTLSGGTVRAAIGAAP